VSTLFSTVHYYLANQRIAMRQGAAVYYLYGNHLPLRDAARGSTSLITDTASAVVSETRLLSLRSYETYSQIYW
jgi:hypothetical protein